MDIVSREQWLAARRALLAKEKEFTRLRDELSRERRRLPAVRLSRDYVFVDSDGPVTLSGLFGPCRQLIVYHFMFAPDWSEGCRGCSFWADSFNGVAVHLRQRDVSFAAVSRAAPAQLDAFRRRMGWSFRWVSAPDGAFNRDFGVLFTADAIARGDALYNYGTRQAGGEDMPGLSVFLKDADGAVCHTYSTYARGLDLLNTAYNLLDLAPKGRDEEALPQPMAWVRLHDRYEQPDGGRSVA